MIGHTPVGMADPRRINCSINEYFSDAYASPPRDVQFTFGRASRRSLAFVPESITWRLVPEPFVGLLLRQTAAPLHLRRRGRAVGSRMRRSASHVTVFGVFR
jgi:hypothetical protein